MGKAWRHAASQVCTDPERAGNAVVHRDVTCTGNRFLPPLAKTLHLRLNGTIVDAGS